MGCGFQVPGVPLWHRYTVPPLLPAPAPLGPPPGVANCAQPMDYFQSMLLMLVTFKVVLVLVLVLAWAVPWARKRWRSYQRWRAVPVHLRVSSSVRRRNKAGSPSKRVKATDWVKVCSALLQNLCS